MCLTVDYRKHENRPGSVIARKAKEDIYCLKVIEKYNPKTGQGKSFVKGKLQTVGKLMKANLQRSFDSMSYPFVDIGLHAVILGGDSPHMFYWHCLNSVDSTTVMLAKIPKGSYYFIGLDHDIVANQMELVEPIVTSGSFLAEQVKAGNDDDYRISDAIRLANQILKTYGYRDRA